MMMIGHVAIDNLKESNEFLNLVLENINSAILIVDENMQIHQFNRSFLDLFDRAADRVMESSFGQISGCVNAVQENKSCGGTSQCRFCALRKSLLETIAADHPVDRKAVERVFYIRGNPVTKYLEVTSRLIHYYGQQMILVIIYDVTEIEEQKRRLEIQQHQIDQELETAGLIQKSLLPDNDLVIRNTAIAWKFEPCGHIGGDIFHVYEIGPDEIGIYMLDVCGHGISAALIAVSISQFLLSLHNRMRLTGKTFRPEAVMQRLEAAFPMEKFDSFLSIAYAVLNIETGHLLCSNAGLMPPVIARASGQLEILSKHGTAIGSGFATEISLEENRLQAGDRLFFYTDGVIENYGTDGEREGKNRFYASIEAFRHLNLTDLVERIFDDAASLRGGSSPLDDMSLMALEFSG